jgi:hypothetical protein
MLHVDSSSLILRCGKKPRPNQHSDNPLVTYFLVGNWDMFVWVVNELLVFNTSKNLVHEITVHIKFFACLLDHYLGLSIIVFGSLFSYICQW